LRVEIVGTIQVKIPGNPPLRWMPVVAVTAAVEERRARSEEHVMASVIFEPDLIFRSEVDHLAGPWLPAQSHTQRRIFGRQRAAVHAAVADDARICRNRRAVANRWIAEADVRFQLRVTAVSVPGLRRA